MSLIRLNGVTKRFDRQLILREIFFRINTGDIIGLIGKNGAGKTTLLKLILNQEQPDDGTVDLNAGIRVGYFSQFSELNDDDTVDHILERIFEDIRRTEEELETITERLGRSDITPEEMEASIDRQAECTALMEHRDGWNYRHRIDTVLSKLGFTERYRQRPLSALSGGWRNRAALAKILLEEPDLLLLDEPTNYLDIAGLNWLETWIKRFKGGVIIVSHDRHFLDQVVNRIIEVENYHLQEYKGNYSDFIREKNIRIKSLERQFEFEETLLVLESEAIADRKAAQKNPDEVLKRKLANIKKQVAPRPIDKVVTGIYDGLHISNKLCHIEHISKAYGEQTILTDLSFEIHRGDRWAFVGPNGIGKSTLIRIVTQKEMPDKGFIKWERGMKPVYFNDVLDDLDPSESITKYVNFRGLAFNAARKQVNRFLTLLRFSDLDLQRRIGNLSGGEKARVALAVCLLSGATAIILDEPTNHLDITTTQVMERALFHFPGAVIVASHDRFFLDKLANMLLVFEGENTWRIVEGNWTTWQNADKKEDNHEVWT